MAWTTLTSGQYAAKNGEKWTARLEINDKQTFRLDYFIDAGGGKRRRKRKNINVQTEDQAVQFFTRALTDLLPGMVVEKKENQNTWKALGDWYVEVYQSKNAPGTRKGTRYQVDDFAKFAAERNIEPHNLTSAHLVDFQSVLLQKQKASTVNQTFVRLKHWLKTLEDYEKIPSSPKHWPKKIREQAKMPIKYTKSEMDKLFSDERIQSSQYYLPTLFISGIGCRPSDVANLKWSNISEDLNEVEFHQVKTGGLVRVMLAGRSRVAVQEVFGQTGRTADFTFKMDGKKIDCNRWLAWLRNSTVRVIEREGNLKQFRASVVSALLSAGADPEEVRRITGHRGTSLYDYYQRDPEKTKRLVELLHQEIG